MELLDQIIQLGIGGVAIWAIVAIVKEFVTFIKCQEDNFTKITGNHINHNTKALHDNEKANTRLAKAVEELIKVLRDK
jgi:hypothetical protein